jgi:GntR family transcriptional repressor for pyruvate dehydrogenase complex
MLINVLPRPPSLVETVCQRLAGLIRDQPNSAGSRLPTERDLAARLGVSRSVVREAAKRLEQQGLLEIRQGAGMRAVDRLHKPLNGSLELLLPDAAQRLSQLVEVRLMIEPEIARLAAERASPPQIEELRRVHDRLASAQSFEDSVQADMDFHRCLAGICGNQIATLLLHSLSELLQASLSIGYQRVTVTNPIKEHGRILDAVAKGDGPGAARAMARHLATASADLGLNSLRRKETK